MSNKLWIYFYNLALAYDQWINAVLLGDPDESISGRLGRALRSGRPKWWVRPLAKHVDWMFLKLFSEANHVDQSVEPEELYSKELWTWIRKPDLNE